MGRSARDRGRVSGNREVPLASEKGARGEQVSLRERGEPSDDHGWSTPPWLHGLQRSSRHAVFAEPLIRPCLRSAAAAYCEHVGWYLHVGASATPGEGRERAQRQAEDLHAAAFKSSSTCSPSHAAALRRRRFHETGPHHEHVVAAGRNLLESGAPELPQPSLDPVPLNRRAGALRYGEAEPGIVVLLFARKPVENEVPRRRRAALPVDGIEVLRSAEPVPALHDSSD